MITPHQVFWLGLSLNVVMRWEHARTISRESEGVNKDGFSPGSEPYEPVHWSEGSWRMWVKAQLLGMGYFRSGGIAPPGTEDWVKTRLHIFFIYLEETEEQLDRLVEHEKKEKPFIAGKRPSESTVVLQPIDKTAARVAPIDT